MKNLFIKKITLLLGVVMLCTGCSDYLSELPDGRTLVDSPEKISELITGAYPNANFMLMAEIMSDNVSDKGVKDQTVDIEEVFYSWGVTTFDTRDTPTQYWNSCYKAISQANQALVSIEELGDGTLSAQRGEALLARAYAHFMLVNFWGKSYNPATANTDLGIPYVLEPETVLLKDYKRNTVAEVYELIEKDLIEGLSLVGNAYSNPKFHFTKDAGNAFAARFYMYKADWDKVISYSSKVLSVSSAKIRDLEEYNALSYAQYSQRYASVNESANILVASVSSLYARRFASTRYGLEVSKANELFFGGAGNPFGKQWLYGVYGNDEVYNIPKFEEYFKVTNASAGIGQPNTGIVLFSVDELLLNRAEAYAMKKEYTNALADLNLFLSKKTRGYDASTDQLTDAMVVTQNPVVDGEFNPYYTIDNTQFSYVKAVAEYKRREFYHEGLRWFDVKRLGIKVIHNFSDGSQKTLAKDDNKRQLQIPNTAIDFGLTANPR